MFLLLVVRMGWDIYVGFGDGIDLGHHGNLVIRKNMCSKWIITKMKEVLVLLRPNESFEDGPKINNEYKNVVGKGSN